MELDQKVRQIQSRLKAIEALHSDYFQSRPSMAGIGKHERLSEHYILSIRVDERGPVGEITFHIHSTLPEEIKHLCSEAVTAVFSLD